MKQQTQSWSALGLVVLLLVAGCGQTHQPTAPVGTAASALTPEECLESAENGKVAICHRTFGTPPHVLINIAEKACVNAHADNHPEDFVDTTGDCSCVGDGQACQAGAPCCSGNCIEGACAAACAPNGSSCQAGAECCLGVCTNGACCKGFKARCTTGDECCSGSCAPGSPSTCRS